MCDVKMKNVNVASFNHKNRQSRSFCLFKFELGFESVSFWEREWLKYEEQTFFIQGRKPATITTSRIWTQLLEQLAYAGTDVTFSNLLFFLRIPIFVELKIKKWGALYFRYWLCWQTFQHNQINIKRLVLSYARISHSAWVVVQEIMFFALCFVHLKI